MHVTPLAGVWIEIRLSIRRLTLPGSHPSRVCGLKFSDHDLYLMDEYVTPLAGVWIEISWDYGGFAICLVTPLAGVWIEMAMSRKSPMTSRRSHPSRVCGLKFLTIAEHTPYSCHTPRGCVD